MPVHFGWKQSGVVFQPGSGARFSSDQAPQLASTAGQPNYPPRLKRQLPRAKIGPAWSEAGLRVNQTIVPSVPRNFHVERASATRLSAELGDIRHHETVCKEPETKPPTSSRGQVFPVMLQEGPGLGSAQESRTGQWRSTPVTPRPRTL